MAEKVKIHPITPHQKRIFEVVDHIKNDEVIMFPTDTHYALGTLYSNKRGIDKIRQIRQLPKDHLMTLLCDSMSAISKFAQITDENFKIIKRLIPGPYTFILPSTRMVPKLLLNSKRKTIGFRVPDSQICLKLLEELGEPLIATTAKLPEHVGNNEMYEDRIELLRVMDKFVDLMIDDEQELTKQASTVIDMTKEDAIIIRKGLGFEKVEEAFALHDKTILHDEQEV